MKLVDLDPRWLLREGQRVGFVFRSPKHPRWYQSCLIARTGHKEQRELFNAALGDLVADPQYAYSKVQHCNPECAWAVADGIDAATFETMSVTPSLDGSPGGLWHGFITAGEIVGGL